MQLRCGVVVARVRPNVPASMKFVSTERWYPPSAKLPRVDVGQGRRLVVGAARRCCWMAAARMEQFAVTTISEALVLLRPANESWLVMDSFID